MATTTLPKASHPERITVRGHDWSYVHLRMLLDPPAEGPQSPSWPPDILTWRTTLTLALAQYLGITGSAISIDILHLENDEAWLRIPGNEMERFGTAVSGYVGSLEGRSVGFRTVNMGQFLMGLVGRKEEEAAVWEG